MSADDALVVLNTCPNPLDPSPEWSPKPTDLALYPPAASSRSWYAAGLNRGVQSA